MTRTETMKLLGLIIVAYPTSKLSDDDDTINLWWEMLADLPADTAALATKSMIATLKFPPTIADIREAVAKSLAEARGDLTAGEAWAKVQQTFRMPGYGYYNPAKSREFLGEHIWSVIKMVSGTYCDLCMSEDVNVAARFRMAYEAQAAQEQYRAQVPASVQEHLKALGAGQMLKRIGGGTT